jgi:hypothetical protein
MAIGAERSSPASACPKPSSFRIKMRMGAVTEFEAPDANMESHAKAKAPQL